MATSFSYAQAAKGVSTPSTTSKSASGAATPANDAKTAPVPGSIAAARSWAEDVETESLPGQPPTAREAQSQQSSSNATTVQDSVDASNVSSPDMGASSSSTVTKDDDVSSIPNTASDSTWDNKSQASTSVDKSVEPVEKTSDKVKKGKSAVVKPLHEAPVPTVNPWKLRADELKAKVQKPTPPPITNGVSQGPNGVQAKKGESGAQEKATNGESRSKGRPEISHGRKDAKGDADAKNGVKGRFPEKEAKPASTVSPPPPNRDQESWPTPDTAIDEDRKKAQEKVEKVGKERKDGASSSKNDWVKIPYTPSVVFNTPLPSVASARRGGRPGGRGGAQTGGRPTAYNGNGAEHSEKDGSAPGAVTNGEQTKRDRPEAAAPRDTSPKLKRTGSAASPTMRDQVPVMNGENTAKSADPVASEADIQNRIASTSSQIPGQSSTHSRQYPNKPTKARRGDFPGAGERRRDGAASPTKDNTFAGRPVSAGTQTDSLGDGERRAHTYQDGSYGHSKRFGSFSGGRERGRGGGRGARAGYNNSHQFTNGHPSSGFSLGPRSPTSFVPENTSFFAPQSKYGRNGHRSQSLTTDPYRYQPYQNGYTGPPLQTPQDMYNYGMMQPLSPATPYSPYGVDQFQVIALITTQVEYYFSVDNLIKDMYLRRHMDSQGFVKFDFIAGFNRIKTLSPDLDLVRHVCQQSSAIEYRTGEDGQDRLRRKDGWQKWVLGMAERDETAKNDGPKELKLPHVPHLPGLDQFSQSQWPTMSPGIPTAPFGNEGAYPQMNGYHGVPQDAAMAPSEESLNGTVVEEANGTAAPNGHLIETLTKAVSGEPDSFSDLQLVGLAVLVRNKNAVSDEAEKAITCQLRVNGASSSDGKVDNHVVEERPKSVTNPFRPTSPAHVRLYWVKDQDGPVHSIPSDSSHESYYHLRSKALQQRQNASLGTTPYDMDVLYQF